MKMDHDVIVSRWEQRLQDAKGWAADLRAAVSESVIEDYDEDALVRAGKDADSAVMLYENLVSRLKAMRDKAR